MATATSGSKYPFKQIGGRTGIEVLAAGKRRENGNGHGESNHVEMKRILAR